LIRSEYVFEEPLTAAHDGVERQLVVNHHDVGQVAGLQPADPSQREGLAGIGGLQAGNLADVVVVDDQLSLHGVMRRSEWLFEDIL